MPGLGDFLYGAGVTEVHLRGSDKVDHHVGAGGAVRHGMYTANLFHVRSIGLSPPSMIDVLDNRLNVAQGRGAPWKTKKDKKEVRRRKVTSGSVGGLAVVSAIDVNRNRSFETRNGSG